MEQNSSNVIKPMSVVAQEAINYIKGRREHNVVSLKTRWKKFNKQCMGGIEFTLEMVGFRQVGRTLSNKLRKTTSTLYSSETDLDDDTFGNVIKVCNQLKGYPIYFVDEPKTPMQVQEIIYSFYNTHVKGTKKHFVILYDHALLTKPIGSVLETIAELQRVFIQVKKLPLTSIIQIAQMNRNIEAPERINNPLSHYPMRSDISSSDAIFQASDYVMVIHRPEMLGITEYGPNTYTKQGLYSRFEEQGCW